MRRWKRIKRIVPELVAVLIIHGNVERDYACAACGAGVAEEYSYCPMCGAELLWKEADDGKQIL